MQKTKFAIDFLGDKTFEGYTRGEDWNGFACPYFTFEEAQQIVNAWRAAGSNAFYDTVNDQFIFEMGSGETDSFASTEMEGVKVYPIGSFCWVWSDAA